LKPDWPCALQRKRATKLFEVWDNITEAEVEELEGLFRHIYRKDTGANPLNEQRGFKKLKAVGKQRLADW